MLALLLVAAVFPSIISGQIFSCGSGIPAPFTSNIGGCNASPCNFDREETFRFTYSFVANAATSWLNLTIVANYLGEDHILDVHPQYSNVCTNSTPSCPVEAGQIVSNTVAVPLPPHLGHGMNVFLTIRITNAQNVVQLCAGVNSYVHG